MDLVPATAAHVDALISRYAAVGDFPPSKGHAAHEPPAHRAGLGPDRGLSGVVVAGDIHALVRPHLEAVLERGESLLGTVVGTQRKAFSGRMLALGVTDRRLVVQSLTRRSEPDGAPTSLTIDEVRSAWAGTAGSEWWNTEWPVTDAALTMRLKLADGTKLTLDFMRGGDGLLGRLGGGEAQEAGVAALADWMRRGGRS